MGQVILGLNQEMVYEPGKGIEVRLKHRGSLPDAVTHHLNRAGKELSLALQYLARPEDKSQQKPAKVRKKIEVEEA